MLEKDIVPLKKGKVVITTVVRTFMRLKRATLTGPFEILIGTAMLIIPFLDRVRRKRRVPH
jgi:hypothetical protein